MSVLIFVRDATLITLFIVKKFIDQSADPLIRPQAEGKNMSRVDLEASTNISNYLLDQKDESVDENGNTVLHELARYEGSLDELEI